MHLAIRIIITCIASILLFFCSNKMLQILQMSSYRAKEVFAWLKKTRFEFVSRYFSLAFFSLVSMIIFVACFGNKEYIGYIGFLFFAALSVAFILISRRQTKVPLKVTARIKRLSVVLIVLYLALCYPLVYLTEFIVIQYTLVGVLPLFVPLVVLLANLILLPVEKAIHKRYETVAEKKLDSMPDLIKIGITGSFGKTTAKNILHALLSQRFQVCSSPKSYNTLMGLVRTVNEQLQPHDQVFIAEMGARYVGDIRETAQFVRPSIGLLTGIGNMHMETFQNRENIVRTKYELIEALPAGGLAVFNGGSEDLVRLFDQEKHDKLMTYSMQSRISVFTENVLYTDTGMQFDLIIQQEREKIELCLLGDHIPNVFALCALTAFELGVTLKEIAAAAKMLQPVPHRLQLLKNGKSIIIDDAYNSNPQGAKNALGVMCQFEGQKIVVTPGMVELGDESKTAHILFGAQIAESAEYAILIGRNAVHMQAGALRAGMNQEHIFVVKTLDEAMDRLQKIENDRNRVILFENDLPDNY